MREVFVPRVCASLQADPSLQNNSSSLWEGSGECQQELLKGEGCSARHLAQNSGFLAVLWLLSAAQRKSSRSHWLKVSTSPWLSSWITQLLLKWFACFSVFRRGEKIQHRYSHIKRKKINRLLLRPQIISFQARLHLFALADIS